MTPFLRADPKVLVHGITGHQGRFHTESMLQFGSKVVGGVTPGREGEEVFGVPVFNNVSRAVKETGANTSVVFVPANFVRDSVIEAIDASIETTVVISEHVPVHDAIDLVQYARLMGSRIIGPNCPGYAIPGKAKVGIMPSMIFRPGIVGVVSRSGTLTYEIVNALTEAGIGQSACLGIGGDPVVGTTFVESLKELEEMPETEVIVLIGEIGGSAEEEAASYIAKKVKKPVCAYVAGRSAPPGKRMGHAGAIISRGKGTAESKMSALAAAGVIIAKTPSEVPYRVGALLKR
jgi:succinyl-CoA synthetase alpha subunit